jgi:hypothetical protein
MLVLVIVPSLTMPYILRQREYDPMYQCTWNKLVHLFSFNPFPQLKYFPNRCILFLKNNGIPKFVFN